MKVCDTCHTKLGDGLKTCPACNTALRAYITPAIAAERMRAIKSMPEAAQHAMADSLMVQILEDGNYGEAVRIMLERPSGQ